MSEPVPPPRWSPPPHKNGAEPVTGVWEAPRTGQTRRMVWLSIVVAGVVTLLQPVCNAIAARIAQMPSVLTSAPPDGGHP